MYLSIMVLYESKNERNKYLPILILLLQTI